MTDPTPATAATTCTERCEHGRTRAEGCRPCFWVGGQCRCQPDEWAESLDDATLGFGLLQAEETLRVSRTRYAEARAMHDRLARESSRRNEVRRG